MKNTQSKIDRLFKKFYKAYHEEKWLEAKNLMHEIIRNEKRISFFNYSRLSSCYYELREYKTALKYAKIAYKINRKSPLVLWDYAGALMMVEKERDAIKLLQQIKNLDEYTIGHVITTTGTKWARALLNDCNFNIGQCYYRIHEDSKAKKYLLEHLSNRKKGLRSLYSKRQVLKLLNKLNGQ